MLEDEGKLKDARVRGLADRQRLHESHPDSRYYVPAANQAPVAYGAYGMQPDVALEAARRSHKKDTRCVHPLRVCVVQMACERVGDCLCVCDGGGDRLLCEW